MPVQHVFTTAAASTNWVSDWVPLNVHNESTNLSWSINKAAGGELQGKVQVTQDNVGEAGVSAVTFQIGSFSAQAAESTVAAYTTPMRAIRLAGSTSGASSTLTFRVLQVGT